MIVNFKITGVIAIYFLFISMTFVYCTYMLVKAVQHKKLFIDLLENSLDNSYEEDFFQSMFLLNIELSSISR